MFVLCIGIILYISKIFVHPKQGTLSSLSRFVDPVYAPDVTENAFDFTLVCLYYRTYVRTSWPQQNVIKLLHNAYLQKHSLNTGCEIKFSDFSCVQECIVYDDHIEFKYARILNLPCILFYYKISIQLCCIIVNYNI